MYSPLIYDIHWKLHKKEMHIIQQFYLRIIAKAPAGTNINIPLAITSQLPMHEVDTKVCSYLNRYNHEATYPISNFKCVTHLGPQKKELIELLRHCTQTSSPRRLAVMWFTNLQSMDADDVMSTWADAIRSHLPTAIRSIPALASCTAGNTIPNPNPNNITTQYTHCGYTEVVLHSYTTEHI